jgi:hypothetical protein
MAVHTMESWIEKNWSPQLGYTLIFHMLSQGWIGIILNSKDDVKLLLSSIWYWNRQLFYAKPWNPLFDSCEEALTSFPTWIKLSNLPLEYWIDLGLKVIGDTLGIFIAFIQQL